MRWNKIVTRFSEAFVRRSSAPYYEPEIHNTDGTKFRVTEVIELISAKLELIKYNELALPSDKLTAKADAGEI